MDSASLLSSLRDIHLPPPLNPWIIAPGWWILLGSVLMLGVGLGIYGWRRYHHQRAMREGLRVLELVFEAYAADGDSQRGSAGVSEVLKRVAMAYYPRHHVASLQGEAWFDFLVQTDARVDWALVHDALLILPYQRSQPAGLDDLFVVARTWVKRRGMRCLN